MKKEIVISGFGGQGGLAIGKNLAEAGMAEGLNVTWAPSYGPEMRGGTANCSVVLSDKPVGSPVFAPSSSPEHRGVPPRHGLRAVICFRGPASLLTGPLSFRALRFLCILTVDFGCVSAYKRYHRRIWLYIAWNGTRREDLSPQRAAGRCEAAGAALLASPREQWAEQSFPSTPHRTPSVIGADERPLDQRQRGLSPLLCRAGCAKVFCYPPKTSNYF